MASELHDIALTVNGKRYERRAEGRMLLSDFIRHELLLAGTHVGCEHGVCGACTVLFDGVPARSCLMLAVQANGHEIVTVEGLADGDQLHPLQQAFLEEAALQCGICTPGFIVAAKALLDQEPDPSEERIRWWLANNLCRCTGYDKIIHAVKKAAQVMKQEVHA